MTKLRFKRRSHSRAEATSPTLPTLSSKEALVLELLLDTPSKELYGLEMVSVSGGRLKRGTVYVTLDRMETKGYVDSRQDESGAGVSGIPRRRYRVTGYGQKVFELWQMARDLAHLRPIEGGGAF